MTPPPSLLDWETIEQEEQRRLAEWLAGWREKYPDVPVRLVVQQDRGRDERKRGPADWRPMNKTGPG